jgi:hypothetical protein
VDVVVEEVVELCDELEITVVVLWIVDRVVVTTTFGTKINKI